jgi:hypothetical protein
MNDLVNTTLPQRAQRIRDLVGTARTCTIEVGWELIAASDEVPQGQVVAVAGDGVRVV